jgi:hypothetical protein
MLMSPEANVANSAICLFCAERDGKNEHLKAARFLLKLFEDMVLGNTPVSTLCLSTQTLYQASKNTHIPPFYFFDSVYKIRFRNTYFRK